MDVNKEKVTKKIREEENASGIAVDDLTEKKVLIEELVSREDTATALEAETASKQQEKETAENMRKKAMETLGETNKRKSESKDGSTGKWGKSGRCAKPLVHFLRYLHRQIFNILFCPQNLSTVSSDDVICISGVLF